MQEIINEIAAAMANDLNAEQLLKLTNVLAVKLSNWKKESAQVQKSDNGWEKMLRLYLATKHLENCSCGTLEAYRRCITMMMTSIGKPISEIGVNDLRYYLARYQQERKISLSYLETLRHYISSFFGWLNAEGYLQCNPARRLIRVKVPKKIRHPFTTEERERLKLAAGKQRDIALMEVMYSTAGRIGEIVSLNLEQVDLDKRTIYLYGSKGKADRKVYLTDQAAFYLRKYMASRSDDNPALFVSDRSPHKRLSVAAVQAMLRKLGKITGIHAHPHKFRRTLLTDAGARGIPLQEIQKYAGHVKPDTTMIYINVKDEAIRSSFRRFIA